MDKVTIIKGKDHVPLVTKEAEAKTAEGTRMFSKKRKNWEGKKKPDKIDLQTGFTESEMESIKAVGVFSRSQRFKFCCPYCHKSYTGSWEDDHREICKPKEQQLKECIRCGKENVPLEHICGQKDTYYLLNEDGTIGEIKVT
jgi:hypothetical protein